MTEMEEQVRQIIHDFEENKITGSFAIQEFKRLTDKDIDIGYLSEYWGSESLDTFVKKLITQPIADWQTIDDKRAIELLKEILGNLIDDAIMDRNSEALEKRFGKAKGTVVSKIFHGDMSDPGRILEDIKKETRIFL